MNYILVDSVDAVYDLPSTTTRVRNIYITKFHILNFRAGISYTSDFV